MEKEAERGTVLIVVTVKVVRQKVVKLVTSQDVGAGVDHGTTRQIFVNSRIFTTIKFIHHHFPNGVRSGGAFLQVSVAPVGHSEVHGVRPQRWVLQWRGDGGIVQKSLLFHHGELVVTTYTEVRGTQTQNGVVSDVSEFVDDQSGAGHFFSPIIDCGISPEKLIVVMGNGVSGNFVTVVVQLLNR